MLKKRLGRCGFLPLAMLAALAWAGQAGALGIDPGLTLVSNSGQLEFSNFTIFTEGDIDAADVAALDFAVTENGLQISGPIGLEDGAAGAIQIIYQVTVLGSLPLDGVTLFADTAIVEGGFPTAAKTDKLVFAGPIPETLGDSPLLAELRTRNFAGELTTQDSAGFAPQTTLTVLDTIRLSSGGPGGSARLNSLANEFTLVPEPAGLLLVGGGLMGLAGLGSRRRSRA